MYKTVKVNIIVRQNLAESKGLWNIVYRHDIYTNLSKLELEKSLNSKDGTIVNIVLDVLKVTNLNEHIRELISTMKFLKNSNNTEYIIEVDEN
jgi:hypothetical protein